MYPPIETPTSPEDHNMVILDGLSAIPTSEQIPKMMRNPLKMPSDTLRKNMDGSKEMELKRTSLKLDSTTRAVDDNDLLVLRNKRYSLNDRDLIMAMSKRKSNTFSDTTTAGRADDPELLSQTRLDNRPCGGESGLLTSTTTTSGDGVVGQQETPPPPEKDENENYCAGKEIDNKNGNDRIMDCGLLASFDPSNDNGFDRNNEVDGEEEDGNGNKMGNNQNRNSATTCDENEEDEPYHQLMTEGYDEDVDRSEGKGSAAGCGGTSNSSSCCLSSDVAEDQKKENRDSIGSSSDESVELREKLDNDEMEDEFDEQRELLFGQPQKRQSSTRRLMDSNNGGAGEPMDMLSPNEGPLARRYAEIAQFNGKW